MVAPREGLEKSVQCCLVGGIGESVCRSHVGCADRELGGQGFLCGIRNPMRDH